MSFLSVILHWGIAVAEVKVSSAENPKLSNMLFLKPEGDQKIAMHVSPSARKSFLPIFQVHAAAFPPNSLSTI